MDNHAYPQHPGDDRDRHSVRSFIHIDPQQREFECGGWAGAISVMLNFVPYKVMFRQQLLGLTAVQAYHNVKDEGLHMLYRGSKLPRMRLTVSRSLTFGLFNWYDEWLVARFGNPAGIHVLAAFASGSTEAILTPFERAQTLLQTPKFNKDVAGVTNAIHYLNKHGLREHCRGLSAILLRNGPATALYFELRGPLLKRFSLGDSDGAVMVKNFVCGGVLCAVISTAIFPINVARVRMQSVCGEPFIGVIEALRLTYEERGRSIRGVYRGVHLNFFCSLFSWGIFTSAYEKLMAITENEALLA